jgi:hypothetical protein
MESGFGFRPLPPLGDSCRVCVKNRNGKAGDAFGLWLSRLVVRGPDFFGLF